MHTPCGVVKHVLYLCIMRKEHKHSKEIEQYASDLFFECYIAQDQIQEAIIIEGRAETANEQRTRFLLLKFAMMISDFMNLEKHVCLN